MSLRWKYLERKFGERIDLFLETRQKFMQSLDQAQRAIDLAKELMKISHGKRRKVIRGYMEYLDEMADKYLLEIDSATIGLQLLVKERAGEEAEIISQAKKLGISPDQLASRLNAAYPANTGRPAKDFTEEARDKQSKEIYEARVYYYLISQGYSEDQALKISTGPTDGVIISQLEKIALEIKK
jgi:sugar-specific transcriptional regulator TrmB